MNGFMRSGTNVSSLKLDSYQLKCSIWSDPFLPFYTNQDISKAKHAPLPNRSSACSQ